MINWEGGVAFTVKEHGLHTITPQAGDISSPGTHHHQEHTDCRIYCKDT